MSEFYGKTDEPTALRALHQAYELGYRHFDTADMYGSGHNEQLLGRFLTELGKARASEVLVATKGGLRRIPGTPPSVKVDSSGAYIRDAARASAKRLGLERIGLYYVHRRTPEVPIEETIAALSELVRQGDLAAIGLSEVSAATLRAACGIHPVTAIQSEYSLWSRDVEHGVLPLCRELGVTLVAYSPLGRGFLSGQLEVSAEGDLRAFLPRFQAENLAQNERLLEVLRGVAIERESSMAQVALAWVLAQSANVVVIPGARKLEHLESNWKAAGIGLDERARERLSAAFSVQNVAGERYPAHLLATVNV
jgi:aryl-alcohol dehydrogenase-like predicted oxidoreductase